MKDIFDTVDFPTEYGSPIYAGHRPKSDAAMVMAVRRAGGVILGKTVSTEFASLQPAGTRNPRNPAHTPGGSSSGSAAAIAAGMLPIAFGSQTGGSVIRPAAYCGVAGYKPSFRLMPTIGMKAFSWSLDTVGVFGAGVEDVAFAAAATTGRDLRIDGDDVELRRRSRCFAPHLWPEATADMQAAVERAARVAEAAGARVTELVLPAIFEESDALPRHRSRTTKRSGRSPMNTTGTATGSVRSCAEQLGKAAAITTDQYDEARRTTRRARQTFADLMAKTDVILTPSAAGAAPHGLGATGRPTFNRLWTLLGPALHQRAGNCRLERPAARRAGRRTIRPRQGCARRRRGLWKTRSPGHLINPMAARIISYSCKYCMSKTRDFAAVNEIVSNGDFVLLWPVN